MQAAECETSTHSAVQAEEGSRTHRRRDCPGAGGSSKRELSGRMMHCEGGCEGADVVARSEVERSMDLNEPKDGITLVDIVVSPSA
jgi:hypothetical protein